MSEGIPNLWPEDVKADIVSPRSILAVQAEQLAIRTRGLLEARIDTTRQLPFLIHQFDLFAPVLGLRHNLLIATHKEVAVYPVRVKAECFIPRRKILGDFSTMGELAGALLHHANAPEPDERDAGTEAEFIELLRQILHSDEVKSIIQSLIAGSNEIARPQESTPDEGVAPQETSSRESPPL
jgi:hypothetical protein